MQIGNFGKENVQKYPESPVSMSYSRALGPSNIDKHTLFIERTHYGASNQESPGPSGSWEARIKTTAGQKYGRFSGLIYFICSLCTGQGLAKPGILSKNICINLDQLESVASLRSFGVFKGNS